MIPVDDDDDDTYEEMVVKSLSSKWHEVVVQFFSSIPHEVVTLRNSIFAFMVSGDLAVPLHSCY